MNAKNLRLLSLNLAFQLPENRVLLPSWVAIWAPDILVLVEAFPEDGARLVATHPHRFGHPDEKRRGFGTEILSRHPIRAGAILDPGRDIPLVMAQIDTPLGALEIWGVHLRPTIPTRPPAQIYRSFFQRGAQIKTLESLGGMAGRPTLLAGDFNLTPAMPGLRRLRRRFDHAHIRCGALRPTYQYGFPLALDHILTRGIDAVSALTVRAPFSDHDGVLLDFALPG